MTQRIVRIEKRHTEGDRYPHEIAITEEGTWTIPDLHLGRWTGHLAALTTPDGTGPATAPMSGAGLTLDDLNTSVVAIALQQGWPRTDEAEALMAIYENRDGDLPEAASRAATELAAHALAWLNHARAPQGRRFVLEDALYLIEAPGQGE